VSLSGREFSRRLSASRSNFRGGLLDDPKLSLYFGTEGVRAKTIFDFENMGQKAGIGKKAEKNSWPLMERVNISGCAP
jgi:hypothetical protein